MATESAHWLIMGKRFLHLFSVVFDPILFILAGNEDMHKTSDEFEFRPDWTTDYGVSCPWASEKFPIDLCWENGVSKLARSFLIGSSSNLLVTRTGIKSQMSSKSSQIGSVTSELNALCGRIKFSTDILWNLQVQLTFQTLEFLSHFSRKLWGLEDWN